MAGYIQEDPIYFPYEGSKEEGWDFNRFILTFFQHYEKRVDELRKLGIVAGIIIFNPYDRGRWGMHKSSINENKLFLRYLVARLASYRNVWWCMANEYDLAGKSDSEWRGYFKTLVQADPYGHPRSIHNGKGWYDHSEPWITHLSLQAPYLEHIQDWREQYGKPVINDELCYEGNIPEDWGNLTAEEMVNRFWIIYTRGGYASHGEFYEHPDNKYFMAQGGKLYGKSPERLGFLLEIMKDAPVTGLMPFHNAWNKEMFLYQGEDYFLFYYGNSQQASARL